MWRGVSTLDPRQRARGLDVAVTGVSPRGWRAPGAAVMGVWGAVGGTLPDPNGLIVLLLPLWEPGQPSSQDVAVIEVGEPMIVSDEKGAAPELNKGWWPPCGTPHLFRQDHCSFILTSRSSDLRVFG